MESIGGSEKVENWRRTCRTVLRHGFLKTNRKPGEGVLKPATESVRAQSAATKTLISRFCESNFRWNWIQRNKKSNRNSVEGGCVWSFRVSLATFLSRNKTRRCTRFHQGKKTTAVDPICVVKFESLLNQSNWGSSEVSFTLLKKRAKISQLQRLKEQKTGPFEERIKLRKRWNIRWSQI